MKKEQGTAVGLLIFALVTVFESSRLGVWERGFPTSGTFPFFLGILLVILSALYFRKFVLKKAEQQALDMLKSLWAEEPEPVAEVSKVNWKKVLLSVGAIAAYPFLYILGGYIIGTAIFLLFMCRVVERLDIRATALIIVIAITASYTVFGLLLKVPLH